MQTIIITPAGADSHELDTSEGTLKALQEAVGGLVQCLPFPIQGVDAWVNEEGKYATWEDAEGNIHEGLPTNQIATHAMNQAGLLFAGDWISGNMVLTTCDEEGNTTPLSNSQLHQSIDLLNASIHQLNGEA